MLKTSTEKRVRNFRWSGRLPNGATIADSSVAITGPDSALTLGTDTEAPAVNDAGDTVSCFLIGGTTGATYRVTNTVTLTNGEIRSWTTNVVIVPYAQ